MPKNIESNRPLLFAGKKKRLLPGTGQKDSSLRVLEDTNIISTSSFRYDPVGSGLKSTQQIPVDWSKFENHCFFDSAQSKINVAFDQIVNKFPFDGNGKETEAFFDNLTGYENYIFNQFPKYKGFLYFSGTTGPSPVTDGNWIEVFDSRGYVFPEFSKHRDGKNILDVGKKPFSFEYHLFLPKIANDNQIIFQKKSSPSTSITIAISSSASPTSCKMMFSVNSGSIFLFTSASIDKGKFNHIVNSYERNVDNKLKIYKNTVLLSTSSTRAKFQSLSFGKKSLFIGSGSSFSMDRRIMPGGKSTFIPQQTLSGAMDEVRFFHKVRTKIMQMKKGKKGIYASKDLKLYFKFNESTGSYSRNNVALDSSGNSNHSIITNFKISLRNTGSLKNPITYEKINLNPIIFPDNYLVKNLNTRLLASASRYDMVNPNLITKLIPGHFFLEGQSAQGFEKEQGELYEGITGDSIPGSAKLGAAQLLTGFLLVYAKYFDELKIFIDSISDFLHVDYDDLETIPNQLIPYLSKYYGIELPALFSNSGILEFIEGEDLGDVYGYSTRSLRDLQSTLWKRFLINLPYLNKAKGTVSSVKSTIRSFGINPDDLMNVREFGGPTTKSLKDLRQRRTKNLPLLDFSGSINTSPSTHDYHGFSSNIPHIVSPFLSGTRNEAGYPPIRGSFVGKTPLQRNGVSNNISDGLMTSGSFTVESYYRFLEPSKTKYHQILTQSLMRIHITGSSISKGAVIANCVAVSSSIPTINLYIRSSLNASQPGVKLVLTGADIFDGDPWYVTFGRFRSDDVITSVSESFLAPKVSTSMSSSYFLACGKPVNGKVENLYIKREFFKDQGTNSSFENMSSTYNVSGAFLVAGSQSLGVYSNRFLSDTSLDTVRGFGAGDRLMATSTGFSGQVGKIRFWSKGTGRNTWRDHILNPDSIGSPNPNVSYNFVSLDTGSFGRIRVDTQLRQPIVTASAGRTISLTNFTQRLGDVMGFGFEPEKKVIKDSLVFYSQLPPRFDLSQTDEKIRVRSYKRKSLIDESDYSSAAPVYEVMPSESPDDDTRFAVEFSVVKAMEEDMMTIFSSLEFFDNALGKPSLLFEEFYPDIEEAREVYFRRLFGKPEFQSYFKMFRWFNDSLGDIIENLIPRKTKFLGVNFIYESHPLERNRFRYLFDDIYLFSKERSFDRGNILLSQYVGSLKKF